MLSSCADAAVVLLLYVQCMTRNATNNSSSSSTSLNDHYMLLNLTHWAANLFYFIHLFFLTVKRTAAELQSALGPAVGARTCGSLRCLFVSVP